MKTMFQTGIRRTDIFENQSFGRPYLSQAAGSAPPGTSLLQDLSTATSIILTPTPRPGAPAAPLPSAAPEASSSTAILVGAGVLGVVLAGLLFFG
jgi:hypothetical protein